MVDAEVYHVQVFLPLAYEVFECSPQLHDS
jgi:hypothetical protein